jgi:hypothetical protein
MTEKLKQINNATASLSSLVVVVCCFKFLLDGISFTVWGQSFIFGHTDSLTYGALLTPVLGAQSAHSFFNRPSRDSAQPNIENPDKNE